MRNETRVRMYSLYKIRGWPEWIDGGLAEYMDGWDLVADIRSITNADVDIMSIETTDGTGTFVRVAGHLDASVMGVPNYTLTHQMELVDQENRLVGFVSFDDKRGYYTLEGRKHVCY